MIIDVIVCHPDGTQETEQREVADDWFVVEETQETQDTEKTE